jgi:hypothetical protein
VTLTFRTRVDICYRFVEVDLLHVLFMFGRVWWIREFIMIFFSHFLVLSRPLVTLTFRTRVDVCYRFVEVDILHVLFKFGRVWWLRKFIMNLFHFFLSLSRPPWSWPLEPGSMISYRFIEAAILHVFFEFVWVRWIREFIMIVSTFLSLSRPPVTLTFSTRVDVCYRFVEVDILHVLFKFGQVWWIREFFYDFFHFFGPFQ